MNEFGYAGEVTTRPAAAPSLGDLTDYVYFRRNVAGVHRFGCELWFLAERDTRTNEVLRVELPEAPEPKAAPDPVVPETPAV